jgi:hypothetical protein
MRKIHKHAANSDNKKREISLLIQVALVAGPKDSSVEGNISLRLKKVLKGARESYP